MQRLLACGLKKALNSEKYMIFAQRTYRYICEGKASLVRSKETCVAAYD